jgi:hypothetical protein
MKRPPILAVLSSAVLLGGCKSICYRTMEKLGNHKRDLLVDRE